MKSEIQKYYNREIKTNGYPDFDSLTTSQIETMEKTLGFSAWKAARALSQLRNEVIRAMPKRRTYQPKMG